MSTSWRRPCAKAFGSGTNGCTKLALSQVFGRGGLTGFLHAHKEGQGEREQKSPTRKEEIVGHKVTPYAELPTDRETSTVTASSKEEAVT